MYLFHNTTGESWHCTDITVDGITGFSINFTSY